MKVYRRQVPDESFDMGYQLISNDAFDVNTFEVKSFTS